MDYTKLLNLKFHTPTRLTLPIDGRSDDTISFVITRVIGGFIYTSKTGNVFVNERTIS